MFEESFDATVYSNQKIFNIEKFMYLNQYLQKAMLLVIEGFYLMNEKYLHTWEF